MSVNIGREIARDNQNVFRRHYTGLVVDNKDPKKLGRIRIRIRELHMNIPDELLPWCARGPGQGEGHSPGGGMANQEIPAVGAKMACSFMDNSPYFPQFSGAPDTDDTKIGGEFEGDDYEHTHGNVDQAGNKTVKVTKEGKETNTFIHKTGTKQNYDAKGNYSMDSKGMINLNCGKPEPQKRPKIPDPKGKTSY